MEQHYELTSTPELLPLAAYVSKDGLIGHHLKERPIRLANFICPSTGERQGQKGGVGGSGTASCTLAPEDVRNKALPQKILVCGVLPGRS